MTISDERVMNIPAAIDSLVNSAFLNGISPADATLVAAFVLCRVAIREYETLHGTITLDDFFKKVVLGSLITIAWPGAKQDARLA